MTISKSERTEQAEQKEQKTSLSKLAKSLGVAKSSLYAKCQSIGIDTSNGLTVDDVNTLRREIRAAKQMEENEVEVLEGELDLRVHAPKNTSEMGLVLSSLGGSMISVPSEDQVDTLLAAADYLIEGINQAEREQQKRVNDLQMQQHLLKEKEQDLRFRLASFRSRTDGLKRQEALTKKDIQGIRNNIASILNGEAE